MEVDAVPNGSASVIAKEITATATISHTPSNFSGLPEYLKLEHQFLRVPFEHYKKTIRANHRVVEKEISGVISSINEAADLETMSRHETFLHFNSLVSRLQGLKRKLEEGDRTEQMQAHKCRTRLRHLESSGAENSAKWNSTRLERILIDYMLRMSCFNTATKLSESSNIQDLVDIDVCQEAKKVIDALQNKEIAPALAWCSDNKSRLKKSKSNFEFQLRLQEFIELVRADKNMQAIAYARKYLAPWGATHMKELQRVVATLAFKNSTECAVYKRELDPREEFPLSFQQKNSGPNPWVSRTPFVYNENCDPMRKMLTSSTLPVLFEPAQWDHLVHGFRQEFCKIYGMTLEPLLNIYLQAGLSALKTPYCYEDDCTKEDPLSQESFRKLAVSLPYSKQHHSQLVCYITKELMDTENPPQVLPNGFVYSAKALEKMAEDNSGKVTCPRTGFVCNYSELVKAYIS